MSLFKKCNSLEKCLQNVFFFLCGHFQKMCESLYLVQKFTGCHRGEVLVKNPLSADSLFEKFD